MNPLAILKLLLSGIPPQDHTVSVNGVRKGPVTTAVAALDGPAVRLHYAFKDEGKDADIKAHCALSDAGKKGGTSDEIVYNGAAVEHDDIVISSRFTLSGPVVVIEFIFAKEGKEFRIRFDARKRIFG